MCRGWSEGMNFIIREIEETDLSNGFFETLSNLSDVKKISQDKEKTRKVRSLQFAKQIGCYKVILECSIQNVPFYTKLGFKQHEVSMRYNVM